MPDGAEMTNGRESGRDPAEIWETGLDEGQRRLKRGWSGLAATGFAGGADVFFSILVLAVTAAGLAEAMPEASAHAIASLTFGIGFAFITLGRADEHDDRHAADALVAG